MLFFPHLSSIHHDWRQHGLISISNIFHQQNKLLSLLFVIQESSKFFGKTFSKKVPSSPTHKCYYQSINLSSEKRIATEQMCKGIYRNLSIAINQSIKTNLILFLHFTSFHLLSKKILKIQTKNVKETLLSQTHPSQSATAKCWLQLSFLLY